jgi:ABC-type uncharacterized transport system ATPase component
MDIQNYGILDAVPTDPSGYVTKDGMWAAVPYGKRFVIIHNGQQVHTANNYQTAKSYIHKQIKISKRNQSGPLDKFV